MRSITTQPRTHYVKYRIQKKSHIEKNFEKHKVPTIAASDYIKMVPEQISPYVPGDFYALGTDGFGRSDQRAVLRGFFEVDKYNIALAAIESLVRLQVIDSSVLSEALVRFEINSDAPDPWTI